ncbi:methyltransferase domain-containing protein [Patescibacteria group bacterium]|nr:methyltransferase domain-containing protein [Patescibacteria group bacterium]
MNKLYSLIKLLIRFIQLLVCGRLVRLKDIRQTYDDISGSYNELFLEKMGKHTVELVQELEAVGHSKILDLGSGTGYFYEYLRESCPECRITAIDFSPKMMKFAKASAVNGKGIFICGEMLGEINKLPADSYDIVVCAWSLGYTYPRKLLRQAYRVLKKNGRIGIIINTRNSIPEARKLFWKTLFKYPHKMQKIMFELSWPRNKDDLSRLLAKSGFKNTRNWHKEEPFVFINGADAVNWIFNTGALAGYDQILDIKNDIELFNYFVKNWESDSSDNIVITHKFVVAIAKK